MWVEAVLGKLGYFVELGAMDGQKNSNTLQLEQRGWRGLCIEPDPQYFLLLRKNRPQCFNVRALVTGQNNSPETFVSNEPWYSWRGHRGGTTKIKSLQDEGNLLQMRSQTLTAILDASLAPRQIDYLSLDVEGAELMVLEGLDFAKYNVRLLTVEHNFQASKRREIFILLKKHGYRRVEPTVGFCPREGTSCDAVVCMCVDDFYVHATVGYEPGVRVPRLEDDNDKNDNGMDLGR